MVGKLLDCAAVSGTVAVWGTCVTPEDWPLLVLSVVFVDCPLCCLRAASFFAAWSLLAVVSELFVVLSLLAVLVELD